MLIMNFHEPKKKQLLHKNANLQRNKKQKSAPAAEYTAWTAASAQ